VSFEPRLIGQGDPAIEATGDFVLNLPPELTALGEQLGADSSFLAERYPAKQSTTIGAVSEVATNAGRRRGIGMRFGAAAAAVLAGVLGWQLGSTQSPAINRRAETPAPHLIATNPELAVAQHAVIMHPAANATELHGDQGVQEVGIDAPSHAKHASTDEVTMLRKQLNGFEKVISVLQSEIVARKQAEVENRKLIESLQAEITELKGESK
jgi:hypothetical protein